MLIKKIMIVIYLFSYYNLFANQNPYHLLINKAKENLYNENYPEAKRLTLAARKIKDDPETYELMTRIIIFELKDKLNIKYDYVLKSPKAAKKFKKLINQFQDEASIGEKKIVQAIKESPNNQRLRFIYIKLLSDRIMFNYQILHDLISLYDIAVAIVNETEYVLKQNSNHCALSIAGWINYAIGKRNLPERIFLKTMILRKSVFIKGNKNIGINQLKKAAYGIKIDEENGCTENDIVEAKFGLLTVYMKEHQWLEAKRIAEELYSQFPQNSALKYNLKLITIRLKIN